uniref:Uncharacterized protein n=1 Tax=Solanum lycopersicum TaxID=4081 RepID=K4CKP1_SOLLC
MASKSITLKDLHSFHSFDQELFIRLVLILHHAPDILVWVLSKGYPKVPLNFPIHVPGFPHQTFGIITVILRSLDYIIPNKNGPLENIWSLKPKSQVDDRTMFLTLSRGEHMTKKEVVELFNSKYIDFVEDVHMPPPTSSKLLLYAQMVVRDVSTID